MKKIILFGIGIHTDRIVEIIREEAEIVACIDNDKNKHGHIFAGRKIQPVEEGLKNNFDFVVISFTEGHEEAVRQLETLGIRQTKIAVPYLFDHAKYRYWRDIFYIEELEYLETDIRLTKIENCLENLPYEIFDVVKNNQLWIPQIRNWRETIREIKENHKSVSRYGDGELDLIMGRGNTLQENNERLAHRLAAILHDPSESLLVALPAVYGAFTNRRELFKEVFRRHLANGGRDRIYDLLDHNKVYYDAFITRPYKDFKDRSETKEKFEQMKEIWAGRHVTIIEGEKTRLGTGNDLLYGVKSVERILCPALNAFEKYDEILKAAQTIRKDRLVLIALGATATVLARDLTVCGYQALDIGHIDIEYEWFLRDEVTAIEGKYVNEAPKGRIVAEKINDNKYNGEVIARI